MKLVEFGKAGTHKLWKYILTEQKNSKLTDWPMLSMTITRPAGRQAFIRTAASVSFVITRMSAVLRGRRMTDGYSEDV